MVLFLIFSWKAVSCMMWATECFLHRLLHANYETILELVYIEFNWNLSCNASSYVGRCFQNSDQSIRFHLQWFGWTQAHRSRIRFCSCYYFQIKGEMCWLKKCTNRRKLNFFCWKSLRHMIFLWLSLCEWSTADWPSYNTEILHYFQIRPGFGAVYKWSTTLICPLH